MTPGGGSSTGREWTRNNIIAADHVDHAFEFMRSEYKTVLPVLAIFHFPIVFLYHYMINSVDLLDLLVDSLDGFVILKNLLLYFGGMMLSALFDTFIKNLVSGALIFAAWRKTAFGEKASLRDMLRAGGKLLLYVWLLSFLLQGVLAVFYGISYFAILVFGGLSLIAAESRMFDILFSAGMLLAAVALISVCIYFAARLSLMPQAAVIDRTGFFQMFRYSWKATKRQVRHIIALFLASILTTLIVNSAVSALNTFALFNGKVFVAVLAALISSVGSLGTYLWELSAAFFYMRRRVELEGENEFELRLNDFLGKRGA